LNCRGLINNRSPHRTVIDPYLAVTNGQENIFFYRHLLTTYST